MASELIRRSLFQRILTAAEANPDATAVRDGEATLSYRDLIARAGVLGSTLNTLGVEPQQPVGLCLPRSIDLVVAVLAIFRSGGALLPLAPDWPTQRLHDVLTDARAKIVIMPEQRTRDLGETNFKGVVPGNTMVVDSVPATPGSGRQLAYVIYTSGSTGRPKGVEIGHSNLSNLVDWHLAAFGLRPGDRVSCLSGLTFDALIWELVPALVAGATICLAPEDVRTAPEALQEWLVREAVAVSFVPTPLAERMIDTDWPADTTLRALLTGGDVLHVWPRAGLPFKVVNNYGPSECAVVATSGLIEPGGEGLPPIGRAIANSGLYLRDVAGNPVGDGETGEIWVAGDNVGLGYRGDPQLTSERFVQQGPERFYRTGDLGRFRGDGMLEFRGRRDDQLKIRGYRIEPDEISAAIARHPDVHQSVVVGQGVGAARLLVAYVVPRDDAVLRASELRDLLSGRLPGYMLPDLFISLPSIPLTPNGKPDREALPQPSPLLTMPDHPYKPPATPVETRIAAMVREVLAIDRVGVDDNFFLLGGHSLLGTQLVLRLRDAYGTNLSLRDLFEARTVANLARKIEQQVTAMVSAMDNDQVAHRLAT